MKVVKSYVCKIGSQNEAMNVPSPKLERDLIQKC